MMDGWSELGAILGGGGQLRQQARQAGIEQGSRQANLLEQARARRDQNLGLQSITPQLVGAAVSGRDPITGQSFDPEAAASLQGQLVSGLLHAGIDPRQLSGYQKDQQSIGFGDRALEVATAPNADLNLLNRINMVRNGKPVDLSTIQDGTLINAMVTPDQQAAYGGNTPTEVGMAEIMDRGASARAHDAAAAASYASAARQRAGIGADRASNYELVDTGQGLVRVNKLDPADAMLVTMAGGQPVQRASKSSSSGGQVIDNGDGTTTFIPGGNVNSQERNAAGFYQRMVSADRELADLTDHGYNPTNLRDQLTVGGLTNGLASSQGQQYHQAAANWVRANLRKESGAAIGAAEMEQEIENYFPKIGDSDAVIEQKARNRKVVEDAMRLAAGRALPPPGPASLGEAMGEPASAPAAPAGMARPTTDAEYNALPSGALYVDPDDGQTYRKP